MSQTANISNTGCFDEQNIEDLCSLEETTKSLYRSIFSYQGYLLVFYFSSFACSISIICPSSHFKIFQQDAPPTNKTKKRDEQKKVYSHLISRVGLIHKDFIYLFFPACMKMFSHAEGKCSFWAGFQPLETQ